MVFSTLNQSFSFHSSPESFISSRLQDLALSDPELLPSAAGKNKIVVASILNRKVHIVSSYQLCKDILDASSSLSPSNLTPSTIIQATTTPSNGTTSNQQRLDPETLAAGPAYHQLMSDFFPPPNLLLEDGPTHALHKQAWRDQLSTFPSDVRPIIRQIASKYISSLLHPTAAAGDGKIDLYATLKSLSWSILLKIFLNLSPSSSSSSSSSAEFANLECLQETLLRGQFSLFPVSINAGLVWKSARSKGLKARRELQLKLQEIVGQQAATCPFLKQGKASTDDAASHALLFTSSIAVKALTSLLMGVVLNLFVWRDNKAGAREDQQEPLSLASLIRSQGHPSSRRKMLRSILLETERLSPPVVGVMRRVQRDVVLRPDARNQAAGGADHAVPAGNDIWLYLSGAARDPAVFGDDADLFRWDRYMDSGSHSHSLEDECEGETEGVSAGLAYGAGPKMCLGVDVVREVVGVVAEVMVEEGEFNLGLVDGEGKGGNALLLDKGVRGWLGWEAGVGAEAVARGMKQLPVQRPRRVINVRVGVRGRG